MKDLDEKKLDFTHNASGASQPVIRYLCTAHMLPAASNVARIISTQNAVSRANYTGQVCPMLRCTYRKGRLSYKLSHKKLPPPPSNTIQIRKTSPFYEARGTNAQPRPKPYDEAAVSVNSPLDNISTIRYHNLIRIKLR